MRLAKWFVIWLLMGIGSVQALGKTPLALVQIRNAPPHGVVMAKADLTAIAQRQKVTPFLPDGLRATLLDGQIVPTQFIPDPYFDGQRNIKGTLILKLPKGGDTQVQLLFDQRATLMMKPIHWDGTVTTSHYAITHDAKRMGGLPSRISFPATGKVFDTFVWNDRVHHRELGSFLLRHDSDPQVVPMSSSIPAIAVRVRGRYTQPNGKQPPSQPEAVYDWLYFRDLSLIFVTATVRQKGLYAWDELHFLELNFPDESFRQWAGGEPLQKGEFTASQKSFGFHDLGALIDGSNAIVVLRSGQALFHDGRCGYGTYLHAYGEAAWQGWRDTERRFSAWLFVGSADEPIAAIRTMLRQLPTDAKFIVTLPKVRSALEKQRKATMRQQGRKRQEALWRLAIAERLEAQGRFDETLQFAGGKIPTNWTLTQAGDLGLSLERTDDGIRLQSLFDLAAQRELLAENPLPLFSLTLRHMPTKQGVTLTADAGWQKVDVKRTRDGLELSWQQPNDKRLAGIGIVMKATLDGKVSAVHWSLVIGNSSKELSVLRVAFPQLAITDLGENAEVFFPRGPGEVQKGVWQRAFTYQSLYPNGWCTMQFLTAYDGTSDTRHGTGVYVAVHDPSGSPKDIVVQSQPDAKAVILAFEHPVPNMSLEGNSFLLSGEAVWQLLRGDWFDGAMIYKAWVCKEARWFPKPFVKQTDSLRHDTPQWMRELSVWALGGGSPKECVLAVKEFAKFMGVPTGFHWYNWHQIPFDNDYPHYFPTKEDFAEGVKELQKDGIFVMPYINGRLWDTKDKGMDDWQFSKVALPFATKREDSTPYTESYGSKEADGSDVKLAVMCPTTKLWQDKVREIVLRLFNEFGVNAVYIDQVGAAPPALCFDRMHGHPLGGGDWWNFGYWQMLDTIRKAMPKDRALTTECNAEPFVRWFDGYLTWHWQHDGQVPAFPAVYGGAIQMFGRAYRGGETKDLALRMKAGQQLVFGEQIGWIDPNIVHEKDNAEFLRQVVRLRYQLRRYFYAGEMERPPKLIGDIPKVRADWQWVGEWWVTTDAVLTGAWQLPDENKLVLLFVNVGDKAVTAMLSFDGKAYGLKGKRLRITVLTEQGRRETLTTPLSFRRRLTFPSRTVFAWEVTTIP